MGTKRKGGEGEGKGGGYLVGTERTPLWRQGLHIFNFIFLNWHSTQLVSTFRYIGTKKLFYKKHWTDFNRKGGGVGGGWGWRGRGEGRGIFVAWFPPGGQEHNPALNWGEMVGESGYLWGAIMFSLSAGSNEVNSDMEWKGEARGGRGKRGRGEKGKSGKWEKRVELEGRKRRV